MSRSTSSSSTEPPRRESGSYRDAEPPAGWLAVGHLRRPHGLRGDMFVQLTTDRRERVEPGAELFARGRRLSVRGSRTAGKGRLIARFDQIPDRTEAERWTNAELYAAPIDDASALWVHELIGRRVVDQHGIDRGVCTAVLANPAAEILETDTGALIPSNFVLDSSDGVISVDVPDGLFDIDDE